MHELPFDPLAWLDKYSGEQRCNVEEVVERVSDYRSRKSQPFASGPKMRKHKHSQ
jgi:hypothetical protein